MGIPVAVTQLIGTVLETLGYGVYIAILPRCLNILRRRNLGRGLMSYLVATTVISFILITMHLIVDLTRAFAAFTGNMDLTGSPEEYYANVNTPLVITKNASYVSVTLAADALLVFRTFIVWGRNLWVIVLPILLLGLNAVLSVWFTWSVNQASPGSSVLVSTTFARSKYVFTATLVLNFLCTSLISFRIWSIQRSLAVYPGRSIRKYTLLTVILESAAVYTAILVCLIGTCAADDSTNFFFLNSMPPVIGSVFSYVVIRSSMDNKHFDTSRTAITSSGTDLESGKSWFRPNHNSAVLDNTRDLSGGVVVHLEQMVHHDMGPESEHGSPHKETKSYV